jgi:RNA polymerase sigma factor (sigma-70 family)
MTHTVTKASHKNPPSDDCLARTDEDLLLTYANQCDRRAFEELVRRYERELYTYLRNYLGDAGLAEDAFQGTFLQVHRKCRQYDTARAVRPWLFAIATNQAIDLLRSNRRHKAISLNAVAYSDGSSDALRPFQDLLPGDEPNPDAHLDSAESREAIQAAIDKLPNRLKLPLSAKRVPMPEVIVGRLPCTGEYGLIRHQKEGRRTAPHPNLAFVAPKVDSSGWPPS